MPTLLPRSFKDRYGPASDGGGGIQTCSNQNSLSNYLEMRVNRESQLGFWKLLDLLAIRRQKQKTKERLVVLSIVGAKALLKFSTGGPGHSLILAGQFHQHQ